MNKVQRAVLIIAGVLLLLPGICSLGFVVAFGADNPADLLSFDNLVLLLLWLVTFAIAWGGFIVLRKAWRG